MIRNFLSKGMSLANPLIRILVVPLVLLLLLLAVPFLLIFLPLSKLYKSWQRKLFCRKHSGSVFLFSDRRHGWHEFINNNVVPVLPNGIEIVWHTFGKRNPGSLESELLSALFPKESNFKKPIVIIVNQAGLSIIPLHDLLRPFKDIKHRDIPTQHSVTSILQKAFPCA